MITLEKLNILTPLQELSKNVGDWGKLIVATGLEKLPKVQKIAQSGHTGRSTPTFTLHRTRFPNHFSSFDGWLFKRPNLVAFSQQHLPT